METAKSFSETMATCIQWIVWTQPAQRWMTFLPAVPGLVVFQTSNFQCQFSSELTEHSFFRLSFFHHLFFFFFFLFGFSFGSSASESMID